MASFTTTKSIGSGQTYTTLAAWEADAPVNYTTAEQSAAGNFAIASFIQNESLTFVGSGATGKFLGTDSTGPGTGTYIQYAITTGNPLISDVVTGGTSLSTCVLSSSTPDFTGCIWQGKINAASDAFSSATNLLTISGGTVSSTAYAELTTKAGASFRNNASVQSNALRYNTDNGCSISISGTGYEKIAVLNSQDFTRLSNIQIEATGGSYSSPVRCQNGSWLLENLILEGAANNYGVFILTDTGGADGVMKNSLIIHRGSGATLGIIIRSSGAAGTRTKYYNCTIAAPNDKTAAANMVWNSGYAFLSTFSCSMFGITAFSSDVNAAHFAHTTDFSNLTGTGVTQLTYNTNAFVNITDATRDYRLPSGSGMINTYTADTVNSPIDIANTTRPTGATQADCGCWEFVSAASGAVLMGQILL